MLYRPSSPPASTRTARRTGGSRKPGDQPRADGTHKARLLRRVGDVQAIVESWRWADWNHLRITCAGRLPVITTWVNAHLVAELDTATIDHPHLDP